MDGGLEYIESWASNRGMKEIVALIEVARAAEEREHREHGGNCRCSLGKAISKLEGSTKPS
jgi:hypothetical protein